MTILQIQALQYARLGLAVFPLHTIANGKCSCGRADCSSPGKHPRTMNGVKSATTDAAQVKQWWEKWPDSNIGIATGQQSGVFVIDIDGQAGEKSLEVATKELGELPASWEQLTGGGGRHLVFKYPTKGKMGNKVGVMPNIDIRGDGGYIVAAPSTHISGKNYEWEISSEPGDAELKSAPDIWLSFCRGERSEYTPAAPLPDVFPKGQRNDLMFRLGASMRRKGLSDTAILAALEEENKTRCSPPLPQKELETIAKQAASYEQGEISGSVAPELDSDPNILLSELKELAGGISEPSELYQDEVISILAKLERANSPALFTAIDTLKGVKGYRQTMIDKALRMYKRRQSKLRVVKKAGDEPLRKVTSLVDDFPADDLYMPTDWQIGQGHKIFKYDVDKNGEKFETVACPHLIFPTERLRNLDNGLERLKLTYFRDGQWSDVIVDKSKVASRGAIPDLADFGIQATSENARNMINFLSDFETANQDILPLKKSLSRVGWVNLTQFAPYSDDLVFDGEAAFAGVFKAIEPEGTVEAWTETMTKAKECLQIKALLAASFAAPLLHLINGQCFFVHLWGTRSGIGKSVALQAALSVWGNPSKLWRSFNSTEVGLERTAGFFCNLPMGIDELQTANLVGRGRNSGDTAKALVYKLCQGQGRGRGKKSGGLEMPLEWKTIFLSTGEQPLGEDMSTEGALARVIELYLAEGDYPDNLLPASLAATVGGNYGHIGRVYIGELIKWLDGSRTPILDLFAEMVDAINDNDYSGKHINALSLLALGEYLSDKFIFKMDDVDCKYHAIDLALKVMQTLSTKEQTNPINQAWEWTLNWIAANSDHFAEVAHVSPRYGVIKNGAARECYLITTEFNKALSTAGFSPRAIVKGFVEAGHFLPNKKEGQFRQIRRLPGAAGPTGCYVINPDHLKN